MALQVQSNDIPGVTFFVETPSFLYPTTHYTPLSWAKGVQKYVWRKVWDDDKEAMVKMSRFIKCVREQVSEAVMEC